MCVCLSECVCVVCVFCTYVSCAAFVSGTSVYVELHSTLKRLAESRSFLSTSFLTHNLHVLADYHGNRSPLANPHVCGMVSSSTPSPLHCTSHKAHTHALQCTLHVLYNLKSSWLIRYMYGGVVAMVRMLF